MYSLTPTLKRVSKKTKKMQTSLRPLSSKQKTITLTIYVKSMLAFTMLWRRHRFYINYHVIVFCLLDKDHEAEKLQKRVFVVIVYAYTYTLFANYRPRGLDRAKRKR